MTIGGKYDKETVKRYQRYLRFGSFAKPSTSVIVLTFIYILLIVFFTFDCINKIRYGMSYKFLIVAIILLVCYLYIILDGYFFAWKRCYNRFGKLKDIEFRVTFGENEFIASVNNESIQEKITLQYSAIIKVIETSDLFMIYPYKKNLYVCRKDMLYEGSLEQIAEKLKSCPNCRYIKKRY